MVKNIGAWCRLGIIQTPNNEIKHLNWFPLSLDGSCRSLKDLYTVPGPQGDANCRLHEAQEGDCAKDIFKRVQVQSYTTIPDYSSGQWIMYTFVVHCNRMVCEMSTAAGLSAVVCCRGCCSGGGCPKMVALKVTEARKVEQVAGRNPHRRLQR